MARGLQTCLRQVALSYHLTPTRVATHAAAPHPRPHLTPFMTSTTTFITPQFKLFELAGGGRFMPLSAGLCERIGEEGSRMRVGWATRPAGCAAAAAAAAAAATAALF